jgi:ABC-type nitrate/sulfonate/bicarbonate transport system permease component
MTIARSLGFTLVFPILLVAGWWVFSASTPSIFWPPPDVVAAKFVATWLGDRFFVDIVPSLSRMIAGLALAIISGVVVGLIIGSVRWLRALAEPALEFFRAIPPPVLVPVLMLFVGIGWEMQVLVIAFGCVWPVLLNTVEGVRAIDTVLHDTSRSYGINRVARLRYLILPGASPQIMVGVRQSLALALILMVISEMFASSSGLGFSIVLFQRTFAVAEMWSGIVLLGVIGFTLAFLFRRTERTVLAWYFGLKQSETAQ